MSIFKFIRIALVTIIGVLALIALLLTVLMRLDVSIPAGPMRQTLVDAASTAIGYDIRVEGEVRLAVSYFPELLINDVHIANQGAWQNEDMLSVRRARVQVALRPLLSGRLEFTELTAEGIAINLEQQQDGRRNWLENTNRPALEVEAATTQTTPSRAVSDAWLIETFQLSDIDFNYRDDAMGREFSHRISKLQIDTLDRSRLEARLSGESGGVDYSYSATSGLIRDLLRGEPWAMQATGEIGGRPLTLDVDVKTAGDELAGQLVLEAKRVDVGKILNQLGITKALNFSADTLTVKADLAGRSLADLLDQSSFKLLINDGNWKLGNHVNDRFQNVRLSKVEMSALNGKDSQLVFEGRIGAEPLQFTLRSNPLGDFFRGLDSLKIGLDARLADARLKLKGNVKIPVSARTLFLDMDLSGQRLDGWNSILAEELPPYGPYHLTGKFRMSPSGFQLSDIDSIIGESQIGGTVDVDISGERPLWKMDLLSKRFQINDFIVEGYSMIPGKASTSVTEEDRDEPEAARQAELSQQLDQRLGEHRQIDRLDADIKIRAKQVRSGKDLIGDGSLTLSGREDRLDQVFSVNTNSGGTVKGKIGFDRNQQGLGGYVKLDIDRFDYGIFLRRMNPDNKTDGLLSTKIDMTLSGKNYSRRLEHSNGTLDFVIWPRNIEAEIMDFWAVNVFFAILPPLSEDTSKVNCLVSLLDIEDGSVTEEFFAVDSSKVWLNGNLNVNLRDETVDLALFPNPKKPRLFALETPIHLKGDFEKQEIVVKPMDMVGSVLSLIFSPLHVPMRRIFGRDVPEDASEVCGKMLDREYLKSLKIPKTPAARSHELPNY